MIKRIFSLGIILGVLLIVLFGGTPADATYQWTEPPIPTQPTPGPCEQQLLDKSTTTWRYGTWSAYSDWGDDPVWDDGRPRSGHHAGTHGQTGDRHYVYVVVGSRPITTGACTPTTTTVETTLPPTTTLPPPGECVEVEDDTICTPPTTTVGPCDDDDPNTGICGPIDPPDCETVVCFPPPLPECPGGIVDHLGNCTPESNPTCDGGQPEPCVPPWVTYPSTPSSELPATGPVTPQLPWIAAAALVLGTFFTAVAWLARR